jgi:predicted dienelactone hydrolase
VLDFTDLQNPKGEASAKPDRPRLFKRFRQEDPQQKLPQTRGRPLSIKVHVPEGDGPWPVVIVSHGAGGNRDTHFAQAQDLARHGYGVLCLEHPGSNTERMKSSIRIFRNLKQMIHDPAELLGRPKDVAFAVDQAAEWNRSHPRLRGRLDLTRVAVMGHSFGAYTVLVVSGARPAAPAEADAKEPGQSLGPDLFDARIKCGIALSPQGPGDPFFLKESYSTIRIPVLGISGTRDKQQNGDAPLARLESFKLWPANKGQNAFLWLTNAGHLDFTDSSSASGESGRGLPSANRADVQKVVRAASLMFLKECLKPVAEKGPSDISTLSASALRPSLGGTVNHFELLRK